jgi:hypothetical protein
MPNSRRANYSRYVMAQGKQLGQKLTSLHTGVRTVYNPSIIFSEARRGTRCADIQPFSTPSGSLKLPRFRRTVLDLGDYGSLVTASIAAS